MKHKCKKLCSAALMLVALIMMALVIKKPWKNPVYTITQYSMYGQAQGAFYSIEDENGHLVLIDGGWDMDAERLLNVIIAHGSKVDAWILTHPHQDHISAFENLMQGDFDIDIGTIYTIDLDYDSYEAVVNDYDGGFEYYEAFLKIAKEKDNIVYLHTGDELELIGLKMQVYNAYSLDTNKYGDPANNGALMFKLTGKENSMLFCSDVKTPMADEIIANYGDQLKSDYVQMSHHGAVDTLPMEFYDLVAPSVAFFDCPDSFFESDPTKSAKEYMESIGAQIYSFGTAPNSVELR